jgi:hypothetical protein
MSETVVTTIDIEGLTPEEYRRAIDQLGVEQDPEPGIYLHLTVPTDFGFRVIEIWDDKKGFEDFAVRRMVPALEVAGVDRPTTITIEPLHNLFAPRLDELPGVVDSLPGAPRT